MMAITAQEWELLECFGVEPQLLDPGTPWCCNDATYVVEVDGLTVSLAVQPSYQDVRIIVRRDNQRVYELNAIGVADVRVPNEFGRDIVEVQLSERDWLRASEITQTYELRP